MRKAAGPFPFRDHRTVAEVLLTEILLGRLRARHLPKTEHPRLYDLLRRKTANNPPVERDANPAA